MNIDRKALKGVVDEIEASRARQRGETEFQREALKRAVKNHQLDAKAIRIVLQRRAMGEQKRDEQDYYVHAYELALGPKKAAIEALESGKGVREAARVSGISVGAASKLAGVHDSTSVNTDQPNTAAEPMPVAEQGETDAGSARCPADEGVGEIPDDGGLPRADGERLACEGSDVASLRGRLDGGVGLSAEAGDGRQPEPPQPLRQEGSLAPGPQEPIKAALEKNPASGEAPYTASGSLRQEVAEPAACSTKQTAATVADPDDDWDSIAAEQQRLNEARRSHRERSTA